MKRITQTSGFPEEGAVFRDLETPDKDCFPFVSPESITPPGCILFSTTDNSFGTIPQRWAGDKFVDSFSWDFRFSTAYSIPQRSDFTDLWGNLDTDIQVEIDIEGCYCPGEGIDRKILAQGVPRFPQVEPLPFTWVRPAGGGTVIIITGSATTVIPGSAPKLEEACPCDIVFDSNALSMYTSSGSGNVVTVGMRGTIKIPYTDYTGPFAGCVIGGSVVIQEGRISIDDLDHSFGGGVVGAAADGLEVVLKFNWNWGPYPCKGETITDVEVTAGGATKYRTDSAGAERSEFEVVIGKVVKLDNGDLCYEQYQIGDVLLEGVELPQENIFDFTDINDFTEEPPINSTYVRLWNGTAFNAGTSDCYPQFGALKFLYRVLCSSGDETPGYLHEKVSECISFPSGLIQSTIINGGLEKDVNDNFGMDFDNAATVSVKSTDKIFYGTGTTIFTDTLAEINKILNFIRLADTPDTYTGNDGKFLKVSGNKLVFTSAPSGGGESNSVVFEGGLAKDFQNNFGIDFDNADNTLVPDLTNKILHGFGATVLVDTLSDINAILQFIRLADTPTTYTGNAGKFAVVNTGETALSFTDAPAGGIAQSVIVNGGLQLVNSDFGMTMANTEAASPDATAQLYFENGGDGVPQKATLADLLGTLGVDGTINITDDVTFDTGTGVFKKIRRTGVVITDGIITDLGTLGSATVFTAVSCSSG